MSALPQAPTSYAHCSSGRHVLSASSRKWKRVAQEQLWPAMCRVAKAAKASLRQSGALPLLGKRPRRLRVTETLSLGEKRFVSILEVDGQSFLMGGSGTGLTLLATLNPEQSPFQHLLQQTTQLDEVR